MSLGTVALIGAPSAGKSTIFNRLIGERKAIVEETPGITRDRLYGKAEWLTKKFTLIDTGGIQIKDVPFQVEIRAQVEIAIEEADLLIFLVDAKLGITSNDRYITSLLKKSQKPVILAVNKIDSIEEIGLLSPFYSLNLGEPIPISGAHGIGIGDLLDQIVHLLPEREDIDYGTAIPFCLIGRPNVGKSSLTNTLLGHKRAIVSPIAGTTRDSLDTPFQDENGEYVAIDTAGLLKRGKIFEAVDKYAALRALKAIERSEIALLVIDASTGIVEQDKHVASFAQEEGKAFIILVNKWDARGKNMNVNSMKETIEKEFKFIPYAPILFVSAKTGEGIQKILPTIRLIHEAYHKRIPTSELNRIVHEAQELNPTPYFHHDRLKIRYATQVAVAPPTFAFFCNNPKSAHFSYTRYLENQIRSAYDFSGTPITIIYRQKK